MRHLKSLIASIALLFCVASGAAQNSPIAVAPMQMRGLMPVVEVKLNGQGPFAFMIDTGAGLQADIDTAVAERVGLPLSGRALTGDPSRQNDLEVATANVKLLTVAGVEFHNVTAVIRPHRITA